jgi:hypothetical protein
VKEEEEEEEEAPLLVRQAIRFGYIKSWEDRKVKEKERCNEIGNVRI